MSASSRPLVIFACIHNAGRSQMAAAFLEAKTSRARSLSAGTEPAEQVHPVVVEVMKELGIDLSKTSPRKLTDEIAAGAYMLVTMGCGEQCPLVPGLKRLDWALEDPKALPIERVRTIRDDIRQRVDQLAMAEGWL